MIYFEVWNHESGNAVGEFDHLADAMAAVRAEIMAHGWEYVTEWTILVSDGEQRETIAVGNQIALLAFTGGTPYRPPAVPAYSITGGRLMVRKKKGVAYRRRAAPVPNAGR